MKNKIVNNMPYPTIEKVNDIEIDGMENREVNNDLDKIQENFVQWSINGSSFIPTSKTVKELPSGYYTIEQDPNIGLFFSKQNVLTNKLYKLPNTAVNTIMNDIDKFWTLKSTYQKYSRVYRRNYLIYSAPGVGKTSLINLMCNDLIDKYNGIIITIRNDYDIYNYYNMMKSFKYIEPERKIIVVIEDIDNFIGKGLSVETTLLNILDGNFKLDNTVIIATTNYPEELSERYINRPSRFDKVIEFPLPDKESRKIFIKSTVKEDDLSKIDLEKWCKKTENYTIDHLNELILLFFVFGHTEEESFDIMNNMINRKGILKNDTSLSKKKIGLGD